MRMRDRCLGSLRTRRRPGLLHAGLLTVALTSQSVLCTSPADVQPGVLAVDGRRGCAGYQTREQALTTGTPWCGLDAVAAAVVAGDTVHVRAGVYRQRLSLGPAASATTWLMEPGAVLDGSGITLDAPVAVNGASDVTIRGLVVRSARSIGVWVSEADRLRVEDGQITGSAGVGLQIRASRWVSIVDTTVASNALAGIRESSDVEDATYERVLVSGNGRDGRPYNGDGLQLAGVRTTVVDAVVAGNGDDVVYEHGIYLGITARDWSIRGSTIVGSSGAGVKAQGTGTIELCTVTGGRLGLYATEQIPGQPVRVRSVSFTEQSLHRIQTSPTGAVEVEDDQLGATPTSLGSSSTW